MTSPRTLRRLAPALLALALAPLLPACATSPETAAREARQLRTWRSVATEDDRRRLRAWRDAMVEGVAAARAAGFGAEIDREGPLLEPDSAIPGAAIPTGTYACRTLKLGSRSTGGAIPAGPAFVAYPADRCVVEPGTNSLMRLTRLDGAQRPVGRLFEEHDRMMVFLGTLQLGDERAPLHYGDDQERDLAARLERVGPQRWRLIFPRPHFESIVDVIELVPAAR